ncbi:MAG: radical SAM family heme chaperone HemW [Gammaproteobacteria bacterium]|nr:radical SAM family heme chaperone HemW [Gammaproteobacteria bacterium]MCP4276271.1 radical SAM family heme chaperone HemW [Gammaproteobacteria bacterium]MCP4831266.1 radical SAM family heme chaperone HemW [Gammaproteobacteria bacterium]MCP4928749.1 radical SAM family heme chaperone HemW [Gammaproteobacteria bacterium]
MQKLPPLSLYVHFPWCVSKCPYCDFNSHSLRGDLPADAYINALIADLDIAAVDVIGRTVATIFFGGGTPSLFAPKQLERLLNAVQAKFLLADDAEITLEANPGAIEHAAFADYRAIGINRLSLGVQSLDDAKLQALGRIHSAADARAAFTQARAAGFSNINLDFMYALPGQNVLQASADIEQALELQPEHISHYHLTLEPNTVFYARPPALPDEELATEIQLMSAERLEQAGYKNYEISAWGKSGYQCRHNLNYWRYGDYLGVGAGAHAKLTVAPDKRWREVRVAHPRQYQQQMQMKAGATTRIAISDADAQFEFMMNRLRLSEGFSRQDYESATGLAASSLNSGLEQAFGRSLLEELDDGRICPTALGWRFLDDLQGIFLPNSPD